MSKIARYRGRDQTAKAWERKMKALTVEDNFDPESIDALKREILYKGYVLSTGVDNDYFISPSPTILDLTSRPIFTILSNHTNDGAATVTIEGLGQYDIEFPSGLALIGGELTEDTLFTVGWNGVDKFTLLEYSPSFETWVPTITTFSGTFSGSPIGRYLSRDRLLEIKMFVAGTTSTSPGFYETTLPPGVTLLSSSLSPAGIYDAGVHRYPGYAQLASGKLRVDTYSSVSLSSGGGNGFFINASFFRTF